MKAIVCKQLGSIDSLQFESVATPIPSADEVLVRVRAAGVNFADTLMVRGSYQEKPTLPFTPGMEFAGEVLSVGTNVSDLRCGDRVVAWPGLGGYAQQAVVARAHLRLLPHDIDYVTASALQVVYGTSLHALRQRADLKPGETLLVTGAGGGVGLAACQIGNAMGARVLAGASSHEKLALAKANGAHELIDYSDGDLKNKVKSLTDGKGADVTYEAVGGDLFEQCLRCITYNGRLLVIGFASGTIPSVPANIALVKSISVVGVHWGLFARKHQPQLHATNLSTLFDWLQKGLIKPHIGQRFSLQDTADALRTISNRGAKGKLIIEP